MTQHFRFWPVMLLALVVGGLVTYAQNSTTSPTTATQVAWWYTQAPATVATWTQAVTVNDKPVAGVPACKPRLPSGTDCSVDLTPTEVGTGARSFAITASSGDGMSTTVIVRGITPETIPEILDPRWSETTVRTVSIGGK